MTWKMACSILLDSSGLFQARTIRGGRGEHFALSGIAPGKYLGTLRVTDSAAQSASNSVHFEILPLSLPDRPAPVIDGLCADAAYVNALQVGFSAGAQQS